VSEDGSLQDKDTPAAGGEAPEVYRWGGTVLAVFCGGVLILLAYHLFLRLERVLLLFAVGFLTAYCLEPVIQRLEKRGWSRLQAVWAVLGGVVLVMLLAGWAVVPALINQAQEVAHNWTDYRTQATATYETLRRNLDAWLGVCFAHGGIADFVETKIPDAGVWLDENVPLMLEWASRQLVASVGMLGLTVLVLVLSFHFMVLAETLRTTVQKLIPQHSADVEAVGSEIGAMLGQYLRAVIVLFFANGIGAFTVMYILGLFFGNKYALVVGGLTALTNMVPYVGPVVSAGSAGYLTYVTARPEVAGLATALAIVLLFLMSQYFAIIVQPQLIGRRVNLHPLVILFAMFAGYELFGLLGVIIGMPMAAVIKIVLAKWIPVIGPGPEVRAPTEPLLLDISQGTRKVWQYMQRLHSRYAATDKDVAYVEASESTTGEADREAGDRPSRPDEDTERMRHSDEEE